MEEITLKQGQELRINLAVPVKFNNVQVDFVVIDSNGIYCYQND